MERPSRLRGVIDLVAALSMIAASGLIVWYILRSSKQPAQAGPSQASLVIPSAPLSLAGAELNGNRAAPAAILVFSEFRCPFCAAFSRETLPVLVKKFVETGEVLIAFRHLPLTRLHPDAMFAATVASCAGRQGHFWRAHDAFFIAQNPPNKAVDFLSLAALAGSSRESLEGCLLSEDGRQNVIADSEAAKELGVAGTPTFFIGRHRAGFLEVKQAIRGAKPLPDFESAILDLRTR